MRRKKKGFNERDSSAIIGNRHRHDRRSTIWGFFPSSVCYNSLQTTQLARPRSWAQGIEAYLKTGKRRTAGNPPYCTWTKEQYRSPFRDRAWHVQWQRLPLCLHAALHRVRRRAAILRFDNGKPCHNKFLFFDKPLKGRKTFAPFSPVHMDGDRVIIHTSICMTFIKVCRLFAFMLDNILITKSVKATSCPIQGGWDSADRAKIAHMCPGRAPIHEPWVIPHICAIFARSAQWSRIIRPGPEL